jgi:hypothetical protein
MDEVGQLQAELDEALITQRSLKAETQSLSLELLDLRADGLLLRTVVATLWGKASPEARGHVELLLNSHSDPIQPVRQCLTAPQGPEPLISGATRPIANLAAGYKLVRKCEI